VHGQLVAGGSVAAIAVVLSAAHIELQYVAGAFLIVFAQTLSRKRLSRDVTVQLPEPEPKRPTDFLRQKRDPIADALER
jgi:hypothetical protein